MTEQEILEIEKRWNEPYAISSDMVRLIAEVRRLQAANDRIPIAEIEDAIKTSESGTVWRIEKWLGEL